MSAPSLRRFPSLRCFHRPTALLLLLTATRLVADLGFTPLGGLPGGSGTSQALAISADGLTVVGHATSAASTEEAFRWTAATGMNGLGDLPGGSALSRATAVSSDGAIVVGNGTVASDFQEGFRWTQAGGLVSIGDLPGGIVYSNAAAVSADGSVLAGYGFNAANRTEGLRWTAATGPAGIGFFTDGGFTGTSSTAFGVSADGAVLVGRATLPSGFTRAFRYTAATGLVNLGVFPGGDQSIAHAVSADGSVVVGFGNLSEFDKEAFRWSAATGLVSLGDLPGGTAHSEARAVSADGSVVVGTGEGATFADGAFVWDAANGLRSIRTLLTAAGLASGWSIAAATGVSADGRRIVGYGSKDGVTQAWLLDFDAPPPPPPPDPTVALVWTEDRPQTQPLLGNSALRLGYDNGVVIGDIATLTDGSNGTWNGPEYANGLILVPSAALPDTGTRVHDPRYAPILVTNINAYDLDATPGLLWLTNGGSRRLIKNQPSATLIATASVLDRTYTALTTRNAGRFTHAIQVVDTTVYYTSTSGTGLGIYKTTTALGASTVVFTVGNPTIYDFEVVGDKIYYGDIATNTINRVNTDGTGFVTLVTGADFPNSIDVTADAIYWTEFNTKRIRRSALDGTAATTLYELENTPHGVAVLPLSLVTGPAPQAVSVLGLGATYAGAIQTPVPLTATSTSGLPVTLEILSGPATLAGSVITYTGAGPVVVRASQTGNASYAPTSLEYTVTAAPLLAQTIAFDPLPDLLYPGTPLIVTLSATASSGLAVTFTLTAGDAPASLDSATGVLTINGPGAVIVTAAQGGDASYAAAASVARSFTVAASTPFTTYLATAGVPANQRTATDDPDADGISNLLEFALGLDPIRAVADGLPLVEEAAGFLTLTYDRARPADVVYVVETTTDLANPASWTPVGVTQGTPAIDGITTASVALDGPRRFLRLRATLVAP